MKKKTSAISMQNYSFDVVVVGSGPAGVNSAYPLVKAGLKVAIIDGGLENKKKKKSQISKKKNSRTSNAYDLLQKSDYVFKKTYQLLKVQSEIEIIQSLAKGGLSEVWHGICDFFTQEEIKRIGLPPLEILKEYEDIAQRVALTRKAKIDLHSQLLLDAFNRKTELSTSIYRLPLAFKYRTRSFIEDFKKYKNFTYIPNRVVVIVTENKKKVKIQSMSIDAMDTCTIEGRYVILAAGSINTTRILLRSFKRFDYKTKFLTKAQYIIVCLHLRTLFGKNRKISLQNLKQDRWGQIGMRSNKVSRGLGTFFVQLYRFNPNAIYKALEYVPLPRFIALPFLSIIVPSIFIADVRFPAFESKKNSSVLKKEKNGHDILEVSFKQSLKQLNDHKKQLNKIIKQLRSLGMFAIKIIDGYTTPHYAGGIPFSKVSRELSVDIQSKLHRSNRIYIADSSTWRSLPAKPPTLTIMANASRVGKNVLKLFSKSV